MCSSTTVTMGVGAKTSGSSTHTSASTSGSTKAGISVSTGSSGGASSFSVGVGGNAKSSKKFTFQSVNTHLGCYTKRTSTSAPELGFIKIVICDNVIY